MSLALSITLVLAAAPAAPVALPPHADADAWIRPTAPLFSDRGPSADDVWQGQLDDCAR